jgi:hypothetical protein
MDQELQSLLYAALGKATQIADEQTGRVTPYIEKCYKYWQEYTQVMSDPNSQDIDKTVAKGNVTTSIAQLSLVVEDLIRQATVETIYEIAGLLTAAIIKVLSKL